MWRKKDKSNHDAAPIAVATQPAVAVSEPQLPDVYEVNPDLDLNELEEYEKVAKSIGLETQGALTSERLRHCLHREHIHTFNVQQVVKFLNAKLGKNKWEWRGLRPSDVAEFPDGRWSMHAGDERIPFGSQQYDSRIPLPVLLTVQRILQDVPEAHFYISHPRDTGDDPFLMVSGRGVGSFIIERWDEPDFRER